MIPLRKLESLPRKTRLRKIITLIQEMEMRLSEGVPADKNYLAGLLAVLRDEKNLSEVLLEKVDECREHLLDVAGGGGEDSSLLRFCNTIRHGLQSHFGIEPADWDLFDYSTGTLRKEARKIFPFYVFCEDLRSPYNVGSIFRTAESFGAEKIFLTPMTPTPENPRVRRTAMGCTEIVEWERREIDYCSGLENVFVLETGGTPLEEFKFPRRGTVIVGSEELGASPDALSFAEKGLGRVSIGMCGVKGSLNAAVAFGILMHEWYRSVSS